MSRDFVCQRFCYSTICSLLIRTNCIFVITEYLSFHHIHYKLIGKDKDIRIYDALLPPENFPTNFPRDFSGNQIQVCSSKCPKNKGPFSLFKLCALIHVSFVGSIPDF